MFRFGSLRILNGYTLPPSILPGLPLDAGEAADSREHAAELVRHLPGGVEGADAARRIARHRAAVAIFADVVLFGDQRQDLFPDKSRIRIVDRVVLDAIASSLRRPVPAR